MKKFSIYLFFIPFFAFAQNDITATKQKLAAAKEDTAAVNLYNQLGWYYVYSNADSGIYYFTKALELSQKIQYPYGISYSMSRLSVGFLLIGDYPNSAKYGHEALKIAETVNNNYLRTTTHAILMTSYRYIGDYKEALKHGQVSVSIGEAIKFEYQSYNIGQLADVFEKDNQLDSALYYAQKSYNMNTDWGGLYLTFGNIYKKLHKFDEAMAYNRRGLLIAIKYKIQIDIIDLYVSMSEVCKLEGKIDSAFYYAQKAINHEGFYTYSESALKAAVHMTHLLESTNAKDSLIKYQKLVIDLNDKLFNRNKIRTIQNITFNEKWQEQERLNQELTNKSKNRQFVLVGILGLLLIGSIFLWFNNRRKAQINALLSSQNDEIEYQRNKAEKALTELEATQVQLIEKEIIASAAAVRLQELDTVKTRLYTNITHEFRTPLTVILGMTHQIKDKPKEYLQESLNMITRNGQNLLNLVNQMLDLSKLESGHLSLHYQQGDVVNFLKYIVESLHSLAENKGLKIHFISDLEQLTMDYDESRLQQVVSNLLTNAVKFTPKGGDIYVSLSIQSTTFSFKIKDTGIGITEADLPLIFDRFYQVDDTAIRHGEGTGIGLSLTRELVKLMNGTITVKSQMNKGTEFEVVLPIRHITDLKTENELLSLPIVSGSAISIPTVFVEEYDVFNEIQAVSTEKPLVLIADDNADVRTYIAACLNTEYQLLIAKDGQECEDMAFEHTPDLIISDVMMPFKDGFEVCKTLKNDERTSHIPIIMLTAKADIDSKLQGLERGADVYLMKPFNKDELLVRIKKLLELRQQLQQFYRSTMVSNVENTEGSKNLSKDNATGKPNPLANNTDNVFVIKVRALIEANLTNVHFDVEKLCQDLLLSPSQVHRKLTALTGLSTNNFIRYIRLAKAKELLIQNGHYNISAIAYDCGFNDPAYFSRAFKQEFGVTPQGWREQIQN